MADQIQHKICDDPSKVRVAYFTMEIGIHNKIPTYSGGLGILAGDTLKAYADIGFSMIGVSLLNENGYFYQKIDDNGNQVEQPVKWPVNDFMVELPNLVTVNLDGRVIKVKAWKYLLSGHACAVPVIFLDSNVEGNSDYDRTLTSHLYGGDRYYRLCQEAILGIAGVRMLETLGYTNIRKYHMNEGHAALLTVELLRRTKRDDNGREDSYDIDAVREKCVFTTHTPVAAGHDRFDIQLFRQIVRDFVPEYLIAKASESGQINMTMFGLTLSKYVNGVAERHGEVTRAMFPGYNIQYITNGVHAQSWVSRPFKELFDKYVPGWAHDSTTLRTALSIHRHLIWDAHQISKRHMIDEINERTNIGFDGDYFTIGFARRFTAYKRPDMLLFDVERLKRIASAVGNIQIIFAGKAHQNDTQGKEIIKKVFNMCKEVNASNSKVKMVFVEHYDMNLAKMLVSGCDLWLNTPQRPYEASGTSGMKAAVNGVPQLSTLDGWWLEGHIEGVTGWSIGAHPQDPGFNVDVDVEKDASDMYEKLEKVIIPLFYKDQAKWREIMRYCIANNGSFFNTHRMAQQYITHAYKEN